MLQLIFDRFKARPIVMSLATLAGVVVLGFVALYALSSMRLARQYEAPEITLNAPEPGSVERGAHMASILSCVACHKEAGYPLFSAPLVATVVASNLTRVAQEYSDAEFARILRTGIKRDGTTAISMPTDAFSGLSDQDIVDLTAWLRTLQPKPDAEPSSTSVGPLGRIAVLTGNFPASAELPRRAAPVSQPHGSPKEFGEYLQNVICSHCHRLNEEHEPVPGTIAPPLAPATMGYELADFTKLMRTGKALGDRELGLMSEVSRDALKDMTDEEIEALHTYLRAVAEQVDAPPSK
jgi:cytochrome c553